MAGFIFLNGTSNFSSGMRQISLGEMMVKARLNPNCAPHNMDKHEGCRLIHFETNGELR